MSIAQPLYNTVYGPPAPGTWVVAPWSDEKFQTFAGTWTVTEPNWGVGYMMIGNTMFLSINIPASTFSEPTLYCGFNLPGGYVAATAYVQPYFPFSYTNGIGMAFLNQGNIWFQMNWQGNTYFPAGNFGFSAQMFFLVL